VALPHTGGKQKGFIFMNSPLTSTPIVVTVFGILNIVFGAVGLTSGLAVVGQLTILLLLTESYRRAGTGTGGIATWLQLYALFAPIFAAILLIVLVLAVVLLILGIGLLRRKPWALFGTIIFSYVSIAFVILYGTFTVIGFFNAPIGFVPSPIGKAIRQVFVILGSLIYPALTLVFLNKASVKATIARHSR